MFQNDEPTLHDLLGRNSFVERVGREISTCDAPQVYGIHGDWGSGKTSIMHALHYYLTGDCPESQDWEKGNRPTDEGWGAQDHVQVVWFEAWRYQHEANPIVALLQEIRTQLQWSKKFINKSRKVAEVSAYSAIFGLESLSKYIGIKPSEIQKTGENWENTHYATQLPTHVIRELLKQAIAQLLPNPKMKDKKDAAPKLVVLIDDLDRCESAMAYRLLEGIKIYLSLSNCVFVLGMDQHLIELAVKDHLPKCAEQEAKSALASEYVEKICRCIWHLPLVEEPGDLLYKILSGSSDSLDPVKLGRRRQAPESLNSNPQLAVSMVTIAYKCLPGNPRKIKAYAEVLRRFIECIPKFDGTITKNLEGFVDIELKVDPETGKEILRRKKVVYELPRGAVLAVAFASLYHFHRRLYRILEAEPAFFQQIVDWARLNVKQIDGDRRGRHFESLERSHVLETRDETEADSDTERWISEFADPMRGDIMRIGNLLSDIGDTPVNEVRKCILKYTKSQS